MPRPQCWAGMKRVKMVRSGCKEVIVTILGSTRYFRKRAVRQIFALVPEPLEQEKPRAAATMLAASDHN